MWAGTEHITIEYKGNEGVTEHLSLWDPSNDKLAHGYKQEPMSVAKPMRFMGSCYKLYINNSRTNYKSSFIDAALHNHY